MSNLNDVLMPVPYGTDLLPLSVDEFLEISGTSPEPLVQTFSDPDPTTMVVSGSEKDTSGGNGKVGFKKLTAVRGGWGEEGNGNGEEEEQLEFSAAREYEFRILTFCYEQGFITRKIIDRFLLSDFQYRSRSRLLDRLIDTGFLYRREGNWAERRGIYQLTRLGKCRAETRTIFRNVSSFCPSGQQLDHDEAIMETRILLVRLLGGQWQPERALKTAPQAAIPDGILHLDLNAKIIVEVEFTQKSLPRIKKLLARWKQNDVSLVLYVCRNEWMAEFVKKQMKSFPGAEHLGVITLESLRAGRTKIWTPGGTKHLLTKAELS